MDEDQKYDLIFPPGTPRSIIREIITKYDVELIDRGEKISFANMEGDVRNLLAVRGNKEIMLEVESYFKERLLTFISE